MADPDWLRLNRANWDERVPVHRAASMYDMSSLRAGKARLHTVEEGELGPVAGLRVLHLQCHFGRDSLILAQRGADVTGVDFSAPAIEAARQDAEALGLGARFVHSDVYRAPDVLPEPRAFDVVFTSWGTICWLPDLTRWAEVIAFYLRPGGRFYFVDMHPSAYVFDDEASGLEGMPGWFTPYFRTDGLMLDDASDYADPAARLSNTRTIQFIHPISTIISCLMAAGLRLDFFHEHGRVAWQAFRILVQDDSGDWVWPGQSWLPLSLSLSMWKE